MRHFDAWVIRDPYSIWHYYTTGHRWKETVRELIHDRKICAPSTNSNRQASSMDLCPTGSALSLVKSSLSSSASISLTSSSSFSSSSSSSAISLQQSSPLFTRLPPEIRAIIWAYVFGNDTIHLVTIKDQVRHVRCPCAPSSASAISLRNHRSCCPTTRARWRTTTSPATSNSISPSNTIPILLYPHTHPTLPSTLSTSTPSLLRTCRAIYTETHHQLYQTSTFDVDDLYTFIAFTESLSATARSSIQKLSIQWTPIWTPFSGQDHTGSIYALTHSDSLWLRFWASVASLPALKVVRFCIDLGSFTGRVTGGHHNHDHATAGVAGGGAGGDNGNDNGNGNIIVLPGSRSRLPLKIGELWTIPLLAVRGLVVFEMGVMVKCDAVARGVIERDLGRNVERLQEWLRGWMCSRKDEQGESAIREMEGVEGDGDGEGHGSSNSSRATRERVGGLDRERLRSLEELMRKWREDEVDKDEDRTTWMGKSGYRRLAIMPAA